MRMIGPLASAGRRAAALERAGYSGVWTGETNHDPFLPLVAAAGDTSTVDLGTGVAIAFARNPMTLANLGWDLQAASGGRFVLGLGSQIKPHITRRFSMEWSHPAPRMRELILAIRAIWHSWSNDTALDFRGDFYTHTLMTPMFAPDPAELAVVGTPRIFVAGVGVAMTEVAGEVGDGFSCHPLTSERYLRDVTIPALVRGRARAGKTLEGFELSGPGFVVTGADGEQMAASMMATREKIAFYGSTPAYRPILEQHGWEALQPDLNALSKAGKWTQMADLIDDEILETFAVVGPPDEIAPELRRRYGDVVSRLQLNVLGPVDPLDLAGLVSEIMAA